VHGSAARCAVRLGGGRLAKSLADATTVARWVHLGLPEHGPRRVDATTVAIGDQRAVGVFEGTGAVGRPPRVVHDVACQLTDLLARRHPALAFDKDAVRYRAASHDIGKVIHVEELTGPGSERS